MKLVSILGLFSLALLSCSSATEDANLKQQKALEEAHQASVTGKDIKPLSEVKCLKWLYNEHCEPNMGSSQG